MSWLFYVSVFFFTFATSERTLLDKLSKVKWQCANENCTVAIAEGYGVRPYIGDDPLKLNIKLHDQFLVLGKSIDESNDYWLVEAGDRKGLVPVQFVRERKVLINQRDQIETELDLSSIIQPGEKGRPPKDAIKPSPPSIVVDGTTLPPNEDYPITSEDEIEYFSEEVIDLSEESLVKHKPSDSRETDSNQKAYNTEANENFAGDKLVNNASDNANKNEISNNQIENSSKPKSSDIEVGKDPTEGKAETFQVDSANKNSNDQSSMVNNEFNTTIFTETNQSSAGGAKLESTIDNLSTNFNNKTDESDETVKGVNLENEKSYHESELTNTQNVKSFKETFPQRVDEVHNDQSVSEKENSTTPDSVPVTVSPIDSSSSINADKPLISEKDSSNLVPNADADATLVSTDSSSSVNADQLNTDADAVLRQNEKSMPAFSLGSDVNTHLKEDEKMISQSESAPGMDKDSKPSLATNSETATSTNVDTTVTEFQTKQSDSEVGKGSSSHLPLGISKPHVGPSYNPSGSLFSPSVEPVNKSPDSELPSSLTPTTNQHNSGVNIVNEVPSEFSTNPVPPIPASDSTTEYDSKTNNYASSNNEYNLNDASESPPNESTLSPNEENLVSTTKEADSTEPSVTDQDLLNQPHRSEVVTETLPTVEPLKEDNGAEENSAPISQIDELVDVIQEGDGWFSGISSIMSSFTEMFTKSDIGAERVEIRTDTEEPVTSSEKSGSQQNDDDTTQCFKESCGEQWKDNLVADSESKGSEPVSEMFGSFSGSQMSFSTFLCMVITSIVVLLFSLGYYYLENLKQDTSLVAKINTVSSELFFAQKELASIEEQYQLANENYRRLVSETSHNETAIEELRKELEESKAARGILEDEIKRLEKEIESLVEEGDEMHRMLAESFSEEERTKSLLSNISDLKSVLSDRLQEIVSLTEQLDKEKQEVELLTISLKKSEEKREATEDKLTKVMIDADSKTLAVTKEFEEKITTLERIIEERSLERTNFEKQLCELKGICESLMVEKELAEKELKKAHGVSSGKALSEWLEVKSMRADLLSVQKEAEKLSEALAEAKKEGNVLEEREKQLLSEIEELNNKYESAEKDKIEALTKLQVLSNYFKEKEIQLQEELGIKESQWLQKQSEDHTIYEQMRSLREENLSYKAQNDALKKEIIDQEASFKIQIANEEQKAQENWINLRHTERRLKEVQMEAAHLRSRLTALEVNPDALEDKHKSLEMVNGDVSMGAASPPFMLYPPPDFIPPPPLVSPTRPPPLGRLSSPPLTPPAPLSPFEFYAPPPPSPPLPMRVHKPQPREPHRKQKDSQSSNHSSESAEKPIRRGKR